MRKPWLGGVTYFGWKPPLTNPRHFANQRMTSHATQSFIRSGKPKCPSSSVLAWFSCWSGFFPEVDPGSEPRSLAWQRWHATTTPVGQHMSSERDVHFAREETRHIHINFSTVLGLYQPGTHAVKICFFSYCGVISGKHLMYERIFSV